MIGIHMQLSTILLATVTLASTVSAEQPDSAVMPGDEQNTPGAGIHRFSVHDTNQDGLLSKEEYSAFRIRLERWRKAHSRHPNRRGQCLEFENIDHNGDGYIDEEELIIALNRRLEWRRRYHHSRWKW